MRRGRSKRRSSSSTRRVSVELAVRAWSTAARLHDRGLRVLLDGGPRRKQNPQPSVGPASRGDVSSTGLNQSPE
jgi:hypothetical protein